MIHKLTLGHFDVEALQNGSLVVLRPLEWDVVKRLLHEIGKVDESGRPMLGGHAVEFKEGYMICPWLMARRVQAAEDFARRLHQETGCLMYDASRHEIVQVEQMASW